MSFIDQFNEFAVRFAAPIVRKNFPIISVVKLTGIIGSAGIGRRGMTSIDLEVPLRRAFNMRGVDAVALRINSPGGSPVQSALIAERIRQYSEDKDIPVFAFVEDLAASGGYWLACAADEIYVNSMSIVGSIGVISATFGFTDLLEKIGVERRVYSQGKNKNMLDPFSAEDPRDVKRLELIQEDIHKNFISYVKDRRGQKLKGTKEVLFNGDIWTGRQAVSKGLVDNIGEMKGTMIEKFGDKTKFIHIPNTYMLRNPILYIS